MIILKNNDINSKNQSKNKKKTKQNIKSKKAISVYLYHYLYLTPLSQEIFNVEISHQCLHTSQHNINFHLHCKSSFSIKLCSLNYILSFLGGNT